MESYIYNERTKTNCIVNPVVGEFGTKSLQIERIVASPENTVVDLFFNPKEDDELFLEEEEKEKGYFRINPQACICPAGSNDDVYLVMDEDSTNRKHEYIRGETYRLSLIFGPVSGRINEIDLYQLIALNKTKSYPDPFYFLNVSLIKSK